MTTTVEKTCEIFARVDRVWGLISNIDNDVEYWGEIKDVKILKKEGNTIEREATVGPRNHKTKQSLVFELMKTIQLTLTGEGIEGERRITIVPMGRNNTRVDVIWKMEVFNVPGFVGGLVNRQLSKVTEEALRRFKKEAESSPLAEGGKRASSGFGSHLLGLGRPDGGSP